MVKITVGQIIKTSLVTAFTIATALIWKDVILNAVQVFFPHDILLYEFLAAVVATILIVILIYIILETEEGVEVAWRKLHKKK
ncbi:MAG: DUF5654 family protein [archaeon]